MDDFGKELQTTEEFFAKKTSKIYIFD